MVRSELLWFVMPGDGPYDAFRQPPHCKEKGADRRVVAAEKRLFESPAGAIIFDRASHDFRIIFSSIFEKHQFAEIVKQREAGEGLHLFYVDVELSQRDIVVLHDCVFRPAC